MTQTFKERAINAHKVHEEDRRNEADHKHQEARVRARRDLEAAVERAIGSYEFDIAAHDDPVLRGANDQTFDFKNTFPQVVVVMALDGVQFIMETGRLHVVSACSKCGEEMLSREIKSLADVGQWLDDPRHGVCPRDQDSDPFADM